MRELGKLRLKKDFSGSKVNTVEGGDITFGIFKKAKSISRKSLLFVSCLFSDPVSLVMYKTFNLTSAPIEA